MSRLIWTGLATGVAAVLLATAGAQAAEPAPAPPSAATAELPRAPDARLPQRLRRVVRSRAGRDVARASFYSGGGRVFWQGRMACHAGVLEVKDDLVVSTNAGREVVQVIDHLWKWDGSKWALERSTAPVWAWDPIQLDALDQWWDPAGNRARTGAGWNIYARGYWAISQEIDWIERDTWRQVDSVNVWTTDALNASYCQVT